MDKIKIKKKKKKNSHFDSNSINGQKWSFGSVCIKSQSIVHVSVNKNFLKSTQDVLQINFEFDFGIIFNARKCKIRSYIWR